MYHLLSSKVSKFCALLRVEMEGVPTKMPFQETILQTHSVAKAPLQKTIDATQSPLNSAESQSYKLLKLLYA